MSDWIEEFLNATSGVRSPVEFRLWTAIATIASVLERRVYTSTDSGSGRLHPNMFIILAGIPASGKSNAITEARDMLAKIRGIHIAPDNPSESTFRAALEGSSKNATNGSGLTIYSAMTILCSEFGVLIPKYNEAFLYDLSHIYDNPPIYTAPRTTTRSTTVESPTINMLAAATPAALGRFPESAWGEGFTSRVTFIYGAPVSTRRNILSPRSKVDTSHLQTRLEEFYNELHGEFDWEPAAAERMDRWFNDEGMAPVPTYNRLVNYCGRRDIHILKLSMISAVAANHGQTVTLTDFERALGWMVAAERNMPDVFRAMVQKSDDQLLQDAHHFLYTKYANVKREDRKAIPERDIYQFFVNRTTSDKINGLVQMLEKTGRMRPGLAPGTWIPNPLTSGTGFSN